MGCDIHWHVEVWSHMQSAWAYHSGEDEIRNLWRQNGINYEQYFRECKKLPHLVHNRHYALFGLLAGVRGEGPPIARYRGIPADTCRQIRERYEAGGWDHHTPSYYRADELHRIALLEPERFEGMEYFRDETIPALVNLSPPVLGPVTDVVSDLNKRGRYDEARRLRIRTASGQDSSLVRVVFWFDN